MKTTLIFGLLSATFFSFAQTNKTKELKTMKYAGEYSYGDNVKKGAVGNITVYPETDTTVLFFIDDCRGAPSYNLGQRYSRLKIKEGEGIYYSKEEYDKKGCKWKVTINNKMLIIETLDECYDCGFGGNVIADGKYKQRKTTKPEYFTDGHGHKIYFNKTSPEEYLK